jgi:hypothetical protein
MQYYHKIHEVKNYTIEVKPNKRAERTFNETHLSITMTIIAYWELIAITSYQI